MGQGGKRLCLVGATGLVGTALIARAATRKNVHVTTVGRRAATAPANSDMQMLAGVPIDWPGLIKAADADVLVCALGTTIKAAGSQARFRAIDHDLVRFTAEGALAAGIRHVILVSSVSADAGSGNFYLKVKGQTEEAVARLGFDRLDILRPSLLRGKRVEPRGLERLWQLAAPLVDGTVLHGPLRRFRSIHVERLACTILTLACKDEHGTFIHEHDALLDLANEAARS